MKYVNDAFTVDESDSNDSEDHESPPLYSAQPREGEGFPPLCNCSRLEGRDGEGLEQEGGRAEGAVGFSDDFANADISTLPKDPPPYTR